MSSLVVHCFNFLLVVQLLLLKYQAVKLYSHTWFHYHLDFHKLIIVISDNFETTNVFSALQQIVHYVAFYLSPMSCNMSFICDLRFLLHQKFPGSLEHLIIGTGQTNIGYGIIIYVKIIRSSNVTGYQMYYFLMPVSIILLVKNVLVGKVNFHGDSM